MLSQIASSPMHAGTTARLHRHADSVSIPAPSKVRGGCSHIRQCVSYWNSRGSRLASAAGNGGYPFTLTADGAVTGELHSYVGAVQAYRWRTGAPEQHADDWLDQQHDIAVQRYIEKGQSLYCDSTVMIQCHGQSPQIGTSTRFWTDYGFNLTAADDLAPGEVILLSQPLVSGTAADSNSEQQQQQQQFIYDDTQECLWMEKRFRQTFAVHPKDWDPGVSGVEKGWYWDSLQKESHIVWMDRHASEQQWETAQWQAFQEWQAEQQQQQQQQQTEQQDEPDTLGARALGQAVVRLGLQLKHKRDSGDRRVKGWFPYLHDGKHFDHGPRLAPYHCPLLPDIAALASQEPPIGGIAAAAAAIQPAGAHITALNPDPEDSFHHEDDFGLYYYGMNHREIDKEREWRKQSQLGEVERFMQLVEQGSNPCDRTRTWPAHVSIVGENLRAFQPDPVVAALHMQQQSMKSAARQGGADNSMQQPQELVLGLWPELSMMPHSCCPNTSVLLHESAVIITAAPVFPAGTTTSQPVITSGTPLTQNLIGLETLQPLGARRAHVTCLGGMMRLGYCECPRCKHEAQQPAQLRDMMAQVSEKCKNIQATLEAATAADRVCLLWAVQPWLADKHTAFEAALGDNEINGVQRLWLQASVFPLYELLADVAATCTGPVDLDTLQVLVTAAAQVAPGALTHLYWAQQYAAAAAAATSDTMSGETARTSDRLEGDAISALHQQAEELQYAAYQQRYGKGLSKKLYQRLCTVPISKPERHKLCYDWLPGDETVVEGFKRYWPPLRNPSRVVHLA